MKNLRYLLLAGMFLTACSKHNYTLEDESQLFSQSVKYNNKVDMVIMVDNSSSMSTYQARLAAQAPGLIGALNAFGMDYNIMVVTSDMRPEGNGGKFVGSPKILNRTSSDLVNQLKARINQGNGGSDNERGLESLEKALTKEKQLLRQDALLGILVLSNEDDHSPESLAHYKEFFDTLKPKFDGVIRAWTLNFIGVPNLQSSCSTALDGIYKDPGLAWIEMAEYAEGLVQPICDTSLDLAVANIQKRIVEVLTDFALGRKPILETLVVAINGVRIPQSKENGWEYIPDGFRIRLHGSVIPTSASDNISIDFTPEEVK